MIIRTLRGYGPSIYYEDSLQNFGIVFSLGKEGVNIGVSNESRAELSTL